MPLPLPTAAQPATLTATRVATIATRTFFIVGPCFPLLSLTRVHTKIAQRSSAQRPQWLSKHLNAPDSNRTARVISCGSSRPCGASARTPRWRTIARGAASRVESAIWLGSLPGARALREGRWPRGGRGARSRHVPGQSAAGPRLPATRRPVPEQAVCWSMLCRPPHNASIPAFWSAAPPWRTISRTIRQSAASSPATTRTTSPRSSSTRRRPTRNTRNRARYRP